MLAVVAGLSVVLLVRRSKKVRSGSQPSQPRQIQPNQPAVPPPAKTQRSTQSVQNSIPPARLVFIHGPAKFSWMDVPPDGAILGRDPSCHILIEDPQVSRQHARLEFSQGSWMITDLNSSNGLFVNSARAQRQSLRSGDRIRIGGTHLRIDYKIE
jgi:pSer/pThr/pTyr-binding forkhead associated (FHA) protein